ncbi:MAG TPA: DUF924 family protein [Steroidobacteraceae bacterium]|nr:DUF924 family protein [Steroidobacteraceae bacterium]
MQTRKECGRVTEGESWIDVVYRFWFEELRPGDWFRADKNTDAIVQQRFYELYRKLAESAPTANNAREAVAGVIVLDQFPRNMFRGSPQAYAADPAALELAKSAIAAGFDRALGMRERQFLYMPFQHSENRAVQDQSIELFTRLGAAELLHFADQHKAIIDRFGRFPHRNAILGRTSTPEEIEYLKTAPPFS